MHSCSKRIKSERRECLAIPDFQTLMLPILRAAAEGEVQVSDVVERLAAEFALSPEERSHLLLSGTKATFSNRVHWAKSHLDKAGLVELTKRGHFRITDQGREVLAASPERIDIKYLNRFPSYQQFWGTDEDKESGTPASSSPVGMAQTLTMRSCAAPIANWKSLWPTSLCKEFVLVRLNSSRVWWCVCWWVWAMVDQSLT
jgi:restriction endonuclease Mrr